MSTPDIRRMQKPAGSSREQMPRLRMPVVYRARLAMRLLHAHLANGGIVFHHGEVTMAQERLEREDISARAQIGNGERVPKPLS